MGMTLEKVVPWGRSFDEYVDMFALAAGDLQGRILGCGDGPAGFNAELTRRGGRVVSCDPIYAFSGAQIRTRIAATCETVLAQMERNQSDYVWDRIASVKALGRLRMEAMRVFLADFEKGREEGRYVAGELPNLPFADQSVDLALCSHFLFLYSDHLPAEFHRRAILEMLRVAQEVRIFPVLTLEGKRSPHLDGVIKWFASQFRIDLVQVDYEFQRGGNEMLRIRSSRAEMSGHA